MSDVSATPQHQRNIGYFQRKGWWRRNGGITALYELRREVMKQPMKNGKDRYFSVWINERGRVIVNQPNRPANPSFPVGALLDMPRLFADWQSLQYQVLGHSAPPPPEWSESTTSN